MTITTKLHHQNAGADAVEVRRLYSYLSGGHNGPLEGLAVAERDSSPNMSVDIAAGKAFVVAAANQGSYYAENDATVNVPVSPSDPSNARIDLIVLRVTDTALGDLADEIAFEVVEGTPAPSPTVPAVTGTAIVLARVDVTASAVQIVGADITDQRQLAKSCEMVVFQTSGTFTKASYPWATSVEVVVIGAGGGGATAETDASNGFSAGGGGGGGATAKSVLQLADLDAVVSVTVGSGGAAGAAGGASSFGSLAVAGGGNPGVATVNSATRDNIIAAPGNGGAATVGQLLLAGGDGGYASAHGTRMEQGRGGGASSSGERRGSKSSTSAPGFDGRFPGGGGTGAVIDGVTDTTQLGGAGANGVVVLTLLR